MKVRRPGLSGTSEAGSSPGPEDQRLSVEPSQVHDRAYKASGAEVEGYDVVLPDAVQADTWPEPQSPRPAGSDRGFWCEDSHELPGDRVVFAYARHRVCGAERPFAGHHDVPVGSELQVQRAQLTVRHQARRERDDGLWQKVVSLRIEGSRHRQYRPLTARGEVIAAIGPELRAARVKPGYPPRIAHDVPVQIQRQYAVRAAVQVDQRARRVKGQAARIGDPPIAAERPGEITLGPEAEDRAVAVAVGPLALVTRMRAPSRAMNRIPHKNRSPSLSQRSCRLARRLSAL